MRRRHHLRGATCGVALAVILTASPVALGQTVDIPDVPLPQVTPVPVPSLPPVPVPSVPTVPSVPSVPAPSVPSAPSTPSVSVPSAPSSSSGGSTGGGGGGGGGGSAGATTAPAAAGGTATSSTGSAGSGAGARASAARRSGGRRARGDEPSRAAIHRRERRLRQMVQDGVACLDALSPGQQRVLELRAGVGPRTPHTRAGTAAILDISKPAVIRRERAGLRRLRAMDCGGAAAGTGAGAGAPVSGPVARGLALAAAFRQGQSGAPDPSRTTGSAAQGDGAVKDAVADSGPGDTPPGTIELPQPAPESPGENLMLFAIFVGLALLGFAAAALARRRRRYLL